MSEADPSSHLLVQWLITEARRIAEPSGFLAALAEQLRCHGVDVVRATTGVPILHPQVHSFSALWELDRGATERWAHGAASSRWRVPPAEGRAPPLAAPAECPYVQATATRT